MGLHENKQVRLGTCIYLAFHVHKFALILTALNSIKDHQLVRGLALKMPSENKNPHPCFRLLSYYSTGIQTLPCNCLFLWCHTHTRGIIDISINYLSCSHSDIFICCTRFLKNIYLYSYELSGCIQTINQIMLT